MRPDIWNFVARATPTSAENSGRTGAQDFIEISVQRSIAPEVTPAPNVEAAIDQLRRRADGTVTNTCSDWIYSGFSPAFYANCPSPYTCLYSTTGTRNYWACETSTLPLIATCHEYTSGVVQSAYPTGHTTCNPTYPYCMTYLMAGPATTFTHLQCDSALAFGTSRTYILTPTGSTQPVVALLNTAAGISNSNPTTTTISSLVFTPTTTSLISATTNAVSPPVVTVAAAKSGPDTVTLIAAIAGTLGGLGSFAAGLIAVHAFLKRRREKKAIGGEGGAGEGVSYQMVNKP